MSDVRALKALLKRGGLIVAANWQVVLVQFIAESTFRLLLAVPVIGGVFLVALTLGSSLQDLLVGDLRQIVATVIEALLAHPIALVSFITSFLLALVGGSSFMFLVKGGTVSVLVAAERAADDIERPPLRASSLKRASKFTVERFTAACTVLFTRYMWLGLGLLAVYGLTGAVYLALIFGGYLLVGETGLLLGWTFLAAAASSGLIVWITLVNLLYLLVQVVIAVDNLSVGAAIRQVGAFLQARLRDVTLVFCVVLGLVVVATVASILATAGLGLVGFVPLVGLAVFPLQMAAWLVRGVVFQYLGLTALAAYVSLYQTYRDNQARAAGNGVRTTPWASTA